MNYEYFVRFENGTEVIKIAKDTMTVFDEIEKLEAHEESEIIQIKIQGRK